MIKKLLLTITVADAQRLHRKGKTVIYTGAFVEIYNWRYRRLVHETHGMNLLNLGCQRFCKIYEVLQSAHIVSRDTRR